MDNQDAIGSYIHQQLHKNYVCEILVGTKVVSVVSASKKSHSLETAKKMFREEAKKIKDAEEALVVNLRIHS